MNANKPEDQWKTNEQITSNNIDNSPNIRPNEKNYKSEEICRKEVKSSKRKRDSFIFTKHSNQVKD